MRLQTPMTKLARVLGLRDLTLLTIGSVIGSGIFLVPGEVLKHAGGQVGPAMLVWLVGGVLSLLGALTKVVSITMIAVLTLVNIKGTRESADLQNWTTGIKVGAILLMAVALFAFGHGFSESKAAIWPSAFNGSLASGFGLAMIGVLWAYEGWQYVTRS